MSNIYEYVRHPRSEELRTHSPVKSHELRRINHQNPIVRFNARFGLKITLVIGTMWAAYIFSIIALIALPSAIKQGTYFVVVWMSSSFLQLVLLPIIIVGQNIQAAAADKRSEDTYKDAEAVLKEAEEIQKHLLAQDQAISDIVNRLEAMMAKEEAKSLPHRVTRKSVPVSVARLAERTGSLAATTSMMNVHRGAALPAARVVVVAVPVTAWLVYRWLTRRRRNRGE